MLNRRYWEDYVCHMIRYYLNNPTSIDPQKATKFEVRNWIAVQSIWRNLCDFDRVLTERIATRGMKESIKDLVRDYCKETGAGEGEAFARYNAVVKSIADARGMLGANKGRCG